MRASALFSMKTYDFAWRRRRAVSVDHQAVKRAEKAEILVISLNRFTHTQCVSTQRRKFMAKFPLNISCINATFLIDLFAEIHQGFDDIRPIRRQSVLEYKQQFSDLVQQRASAIDLALRNGFNANMLMQQAELQYLKQKDKERPSTLSLLH
jgi:hypothetical protein